MEPGLPAACSRRAAAVCATLVLSAVLPACGNGKPSADASVDGQPCTADCECGTRCCQFGTCQRCYRPAAGLCGPGLHCPCVGATCDDRQCCVYDDGGIDDGTGPACQEWDAAAPDGGLDGS